MNEPLRLQIHSASIRLDTMLDPAALSGLLELVQKHQLSGTPLQAPAAMPAPAREYRQDANQRQPRERLPDEPPPLAPETEAIRKRFFAIEYEDILERTRPRTIAEKLLVMVAVVQAHKRRIVLREEISNLFIQLQQGGPANPGRDFRHIQNQGWVNLHLDRGGVSLTREGWEEAERLLDQASGDDDNRSGALVPA